MRSVCKFAVIKKAKTNAVILMQSPKNPQRSESGVRKTENRICENLLFREFKETFLLCKKCFACFVNSTRSNFSGFFASLASSK